MRDFAPLPNSIPQSLKNVVTKALAKLPENRYASAVEMREDLRRILRGEVVSDFVQSDSRQTFPVKQIPLTQDGAPFTAQNSQNENETVVRSARNLEQNKNRKTSNVWMYATLAVFMVSAIGLGFYFLANQSKQNGSNKNEIVQVSATQPSNNSVNSESVDAPISPNANTAMPTPVSTPDKAQLQTVINKYLAGVAKVEEAKEYKNYREVNYGDLDNDGDEDAAVLFQLAPNLGSSIWWLKLACFINEDGKFRAVTDTQIGSNLSRSANLKIIKDGKIYLDTRIFKSEDSDEFIKGKINYFLKGNKLVEVK